MHIYLKFFSLLLTARNNMFKFILHLLKKKHNPTKAFAAYCQENPWARECRIYEN
jgi:hypothetical protein